MKKKQRKILKIFLFKKINKRYLNKIIYGQKACFGRTYGWEYSGKPVSSG